MNLHTEIIASSLMENSTDVSDFTLMLVNLL